MSENRDHEQGNVFYLPQQDGHTAMPEFDPAEFLKQMPPITNLHVELGGLRDLARAYAVLKLEYDAPALLPQLTLARALIGRKLELLLFRDEYGREAGCALVSVRSPYGYAMVHQLMIYPFLRGQRLGKVALELISRRYAGKKGILFGLDPAMAEEVRTRALLEYGGYVPVGFDYRCEGKPCALYVRACRGTEKIAPVAGLILTALYADLLPRTVARRRVQPAAERSGNGI